MSEFLPIAKDWEQPVTEARFREYLNAGFLPDSGQMMHSSIIDMLPPWDVYSIYSSLYMVHDDEPSRTVLLLVPGMPTHMLKDVVKHFLGIAEGYRMSREFKEQASKTKDGYSLLKIDAKLHGKERINVALYSSSLFETIWGELPEDGQNFVIGELLKGFFRRMGWQLVWKGENDE